MSWFLHLFVLLRWCGNGLWGVFYWVLFVLLLLLPLLHFFVFIFVVEAVHQMRLNANFSYALWIRPILDSDHGALLLSSPKVELLLFTIDFEADFSSSNINLCSRGAEERPPKDEG